MNFDYFLTRFELNSFILRIMAKYQNYINQEMFNKKPLMREKNDLKETWKKGKTYRKEFQKGDFKLYKYAYFHLSLMISKLN